MKGTRILVTSKPRGVYEDIVVTGTPKPGTCMEITPETEPIGGVFNFSVYGTKAASSGQYVAADGDKKAIAILLENDAQAKTYDDAYVTGTRGRIYYPVMGEQFNMLFQDVSGTSDSFVIGQEMMLDDGTGKLISADDNAEAHPFTLLETVAAAPTADHWKWCRFNGVSGA